ncbi:SDR family NAD(P)-dependent oxidoreductase [Microbacterium enclense]|uniref:SDR family NAD(P)-dependent oxidoreductase n=1 Tax=Microbacterium enclense TaxID=993073 RepID=UPI003F7E9212
MGHPRNILITGASRGLGLATARRLLEYGHTVILGVRDVKRSAQAVESLPRSQNAVVVPLDVTSDDSVATAATLVDERVTHLDALVNNAGVLLDKEYVPSNTLLSTVRDTLDTNVLGVIRVTNAMLPLLRCADHARIVNVGSEAGSLALTSDPLRVHSRMRLLGYNVSKTALNAVTVSYANELRFAGIDVLTVDPGYCATDINRLSGRRTADQGAESIVDAVLSPERFPAGQFRNHDGVVPW